MFDQQTVQPAEIRLFFAETMVPLTRDILHGTAIMVSPRGLCDIFSQRVLMGICPDQNVRGPHPSDTT